MRLSSTPVIVAREPVRWTAGLPQLDGRLAVLREVHLDDVGPLASFLADPEVYRHVSPPPRNLDEIENWIHLSRIRRADGLRACFTVRIQQTDLLIGVAQIFRLPGSPAPEWGWSLSPSVWGTGVFVEMADLLRQFTAASLGETQLLARVSVANRRAERALCKLGSRLLSADGPVHLWTTPVSR